MLMTIAALVVVASCSKSNNDLTPDPPAVNKKVKEINYTNNAGYTETEKFVYDNGGRIVGQSGEEYIYLFSYESVSSLLVTRKKTIDGSVDQRVECTLNGNGAITKMVYSNMPSNTVHYTYEVFYDANGYISKWKGTASQGAVAEEIYQFENGNPTSSKLFYDGVLNLEKVYVYDASKLNKGSLTVWGTWPSDKFFGKPTKNLLSEIKNFDKNGQLQWHMKNAFQLDSDGYLVKLTTDYLMQNEQSITTYTY